MSGLNLRIDYYMLGYRRLTVKPEDVAVAATLLLNASVPAAFDESYCAIIPEWRVKSVINALNGRCEYELSPLCGLPGWAFRNRKKYGAALALLLVSFITVFTSGLVWDVRVEGEEISNHEIIEELADCGFSVGTRWSSVDLSKIEADVVSRSKKISWLNINRRGTVAYIEARPRITHPESSEAPDYANVISEYDGIIEEITVKGGIEAVKVGESVKAGQLLISGAIPSSYGGGFVRAEGSVRARISTRLCVSVEREEQKTEHAAPKLSRVRVNILGFSLNIFKTYGNPESECDIIEETENLMLFGKFELPVKIIREYRVERVRKTVTYSDEELVRIAASRLRSQVLAELSCADLVNISTGGEFTDKGYLMYSDIVLIKDIGRVVEFKIEN